MSGYRAILFCNLEGCFLDFIQINFVIKGQISTCKEFIWILGNQILVVFILL